MGARRAAPGAARARGRGGRCCCWSSRGWPCRSGFALSVLATAGIVLLGAGLARRPGAVAAALAGGGDRRAGRRPARLHAGGRGDLGSGQPGRGRRQPRGRAGGRSGDRARSGGRAGRAWSCRPLGRLLGTAAGWCVAWIVDGRRARRRPAGGRCRAGGPGAGARGPDRADGAGRAIAAPAVLRRPVVALAVLAVLAAFVLVRWPTPGWPAGGLGAGDVRRRPGRRARAPRRPGRRRGRRRRARPGAGGRLPATGWASRRCRCWC